MWLAVGPISRWGVVRITVMVDKNSIIIYDSSCNVNGLLIRKTGSKENMSWLIYIFFNVLNSNMSNDGW